MTRTITPIAAVALALAAGSAPLPLAAQTQSATVSYADLDLSGDAGQGELKKRLDKAVKAVCYEDKQVGSLIASKEMRSCLREARARAQDQFATIMELRNRGG